jgi:hypothetical protein
MAISIITPHSKHFLLNPADFTELETICVDNAVGFRLPIPIIKNMKIECLASFDFRQTPNHLIQNAPQSETRPFNIN